MSGKSEPYIANMKKNQLAFHFDFFELQPGTRYDFSYKLKTQDGAILEERQNGSFSTFKNDPEISFSATSGSDKNSESDALPFLVSNNPDLLIHLGNFHSAGSVILANGHYQQAYSEIF